MDQTMWKKAVAFHGHACPGLATGVQLCAFVHRELGDVFSSDEELVCVAETDSCVADAVQVLLGCTFGKGNLLYTPTGKTAFTFFRRSDGRGVRVVARSGLWPDLSREARMEAILAAAPAALFTTTEPKGPLPEKARLFKTVPCALCGEGVAEHMARLQEGQIVCPHCFRAYDR